MPSLEFYDADRLVFRHRLGPGRCVVGRSDGCDLWLDGEGISRRHAILEARRDGWWLIDRSRHGTRVNGRVVERTPLRDHDLVQFGNREARFSAEEHGSMGSTTQMVRSLLHEEPVAVGERGLAVARARLTITSGGESGRTEVLDQSRFTLGGGSEDDVRLRGLPPQAVVLDVVRGRVILSPRAYPVQVAGLPVPAPMPVYEGEDISLGEHTLQIRTDLAEVDEDRQGFGSLVGRAPAMRAMFSALSRIAAHDHPVLLVGESGTGKELAAKALHDEGLRGGGPFVAVNCAALPDTLFESELFGHEKGAFTGASKRQDGAFQRAAGGTLFLDEIGELKLEAQAKLLRALESREVRRIGGTQPEFPDVRIIAATNRDLTQMVRESTFRQDLYFRLSVLTVRLPPLRERMSDIAPLAAAILRRELPQASLTDQAVERLALHHWPGNVRELRNVLTRAYVMGGSVIHADSLTFSTSLDAESMAGEADIDERERIKAVLDEHGGNKAATARALGIPRSSLLYRLKKFGL